MNDFPEGTYFIELKHVYDGWSVAVLPDGTAINRWTPEQRQYQATQDFINRSEKAIGDKL